jgi:hypothetical protein
MGVGYGLKEVAGLATDDPAWRVYVRRKKPSKALFRAERLPTVIDGVVVDVVEKPATWPSSGSSLMAPVEGQRVANARGVPGTLGCVAIAFDDESVMLTSHHVLFGAGSVAGDPVWLVDETGRTRSFRALGRSRFGRLGTVAFDGSDYFVDCAVASLEGEAGAADSWCAVLDSSATAAAGARVWKSGSESGVTEGVVVDVAYPDLAFVEGRARPAPRQILIGPASPGETFTAEGDSGAVLRDERGRVVGLLWGANHRAEGVACHIAPVLDVLKIRMTRVARLDLPLRFGRARIGAAS